MLVSGFALSLFYWVCYVRLDIVRTHFPDEHTAGGQHFCPHPFPSPAPMEQRHQDQGFSIVLICQGVYSQKKREHLWMNTGRKSIPVDVDLSEGTWQQPCPAIAANSAR